MDVVARQPIGSRDEHPIKGPTAHLIPSAIEPWPTQTRSAVPIIPKNALLLPLPPVRLTVLGQELDLLLDCLGVCLTLGDTRTYRAIFISVLLG